MDMLYSSSLYYCFRGGHANSVYTSAGDISAVSDISSECYVITFLLASYFVNKRKKRENDTSPQAPSRPLFYKIDKILYKI